ncbi:DUF2238 domain-containing protein [Cohnella yongneupensis]|uniref:DUF2238 domain-containing protein n=1 Tax=Cohnella yongneupensis TaxID=425006 RepID=A0ABW0QZE8_9BACL
MKSRWRRWTSVTIPFKQNTALHVMSIAFFVYFWIMAISPTKRSQWFAECVPLLAIIVVLTIMYRRYRFSNLSYLMLLVFFSLHVVAAHFTYEGTPFDHWLKHSFHTKRSYYDRVVHLFFGLLAYYPLREFLIGKMKLHVFWSYALPVVFIMGLSGLFEILEMLAASVAGKGGEARFVGMQGDIFDTQKDMELALAGGIVASLAHFLLRRNHSDP